jgi:hypothetical protein
MESIDGTINNRRVVILDVDGCRLGEQEHKTVDILTSSFDVYLHAWKKHTTTADVDRTDHTIRKENPVVAIKRWAVVTKPCKPAVNIFTIICKFIFF